MTPAQAKVFAPMTAAQELALASAVCSCGHRVTDHTKTAVKRGREVYDGHCTALLLTVSRDGLARVCHCRSPR